MFVRDDNDGDFDPSARTDRSGVNGSAAMFGVAPRLPGSHGGAGVTASWGCARAVLGLVAETDI